MPARRLGKPLLPIRGVCSLLDADEDKVLHLIEDGQIGWAWDFALNFQHGKREIRVLPAAVADFMRGCPCALEWPGVLALVVPHGGPEVTVNEISRALNVSVTLIYSLILKKLLPACSPWRTGPGGSAHVRRQVFVDFLQSRRCC